MCPPLIVQNYALVKEVELLASKKGVTPGQLALSWVHSQGDDVFPIPGRAHPLQGSGCESEGLGAVEQQGLLVNSPTTMQQTRPCRSLAQGAAFSATSPRQLQVVPAAAREVSCAMAAKLHRYIFHPHCPVARLEVGFCLS